MTEYERTDAVNWSTLKELAKSPKHYQYLLSHPREDTPRFAFGRAVHTAVLEPDRLPLDYVVWEGERRAGKVWEAFQDSAGARTILTASQYADVLAVRDAVRSHPAANRLLSDFTPEVPIVWTDPATGIRCKGRLDGVGPEVFLDLKSAADVTPRGFAADAARYQYHCQMAWYSLGLSALGTPRRPVIIAVETAAPHDVIVYELDDDVIYAGEQECARLLKLLAECRQSGRWPGRYEAPIPLSLPPWAFSLEEEGKPGLDLKVNGHILEVTQ